MDRVHLKLPGYEKSNYDSKTLIEQGINDAIRRSAALDTNPAAAWPRHQATWVFRLISKLLPHVV